MHMARVSKRSSWKILLGGLFSAVAAGAIASTEAEVQLKDPRLAVEEVPLRSEEQGHFHYRPGIGSSGQPIQPGCPDADDNLDMVFSYLDKTIVWQKWIIERFLFNSMVIFNPHQSGESPI